MRLALVSTGLESGHSVILLAGSLGLFLCPQMQGVQKQQLGSHFSNFGHPLLTQISSVFPNWYTSQCASCGYCQCFGTSTHPDLQHVRLVPWNLRLMSLRTWLLSKVRWFPFQIKKRMIYFSNLSFLPAELTKAWRGRQTSCYCSQRTL